MAINFLRLPAVCRATALPRSSIYKAIEKGEFPTPIKLGVGDRSRSVAWIEEDITRWQQERIAASRPDDKGNAA